MVDFSLFCSEVCEHLQKIYAALNSMSKTSSRKTIFYSRIYQIKDTDFMVASGKEAFVSQTGWEMLPRRRGNAKPVAMIGFRIQIYTTHMFLGSQLEKWAKNWPWVVDRRQSGGIGRRINKTALEEGKWSSIYHLVLV